MDIVNMKYHPSILKKELKLSNSIINMVTTLRRKWSKHSESSAPSKSTVTRIIETTGSVSDLPRSGRPHSATCETNINLVKASLEASPQK
ncbi:hypothetical protein LAZ67_20002518 [Cordylochernes scorpioides]|uniref:Uncharacterized protein n=1 Tax=Cordylochernes scorpioides TaxID=51811 RepID=A0ABY6LKS7_9ARAC|nr:hypothetical protein LAZ67_20002518 [Cordylochernes scorpioides]